MRLISAVLALAACANLGESESPNPSASDLREPSDAGWEITLGARVAAANHAPTQWTDGTWLASMPESGAWATFGEDGARFFADNGETSAFGLGLAAWGRGAAMEPVAVAPAEVGVPIALAVDPAGVDLAVVAFERPGLSEWWTGAAQGFEHGWHVSERPDGNGELVFEMLLEGAIARTVGANIELLADVGPAWLYSGLVVTDAHGETLPAWFELRGDTFAVVVDDAGATYPIDVDPILSTASVTLSGPSVISYFGVAMAAAGDVNGDSIDDLIVGAPYASVGRGAAYVFHGSSSGFSTTASATIATGASIGDACGAAVAGGGDVSNDGYDEVAVYCSGSGETDVFAGSASGTSSTSSFGLSASSSNELGRGLSLEGDVNGDNFADLLIGAPANSSSKGVIYVYLGSATGLSTSATSIEGPKSGSRFGQMISSAADVNNDGYDDVVVGAPSYSHSIYTYSGRFSVYHGSSSGLSSTASFSTNGGQNRAYVGFALDGGEDVNRDGTDDIVVGRDVESGAASVYYGSSSGIVSTSVTALSSSGSSHFGASVAMLPDVDGDGDAEVAVGAPNSSLVEVFAGGGGGVSSSVLTSLSGGSSTYGTSLVGLDANGDGYGDLTVGESYDSSYLGKVYLYYGYVDSDGDGYSAGGTGVGADCDDDDATIFPGATELPADGIDQDCDNSEKCYIDADDDGSLDGSGTLQKSDDGDCDDETEGIEGDPVDDCDDEDADVYTGAFEIVGNQVDNDCDGSEDCFHDDDDDGYLDATGDSVHSADIDCLDAYESPIGTLTTDCDDASAARNPAASETVGDGVDSDCNGGEVCYADTDGDGYRTTTTVASIDADCSDAGEALSTAPADDCDDTSAARNPGETEITGTEIDENCDGSEVCYADADRDGWGDSATTVASTDEDCDDTGEAGAADGDCNDGNPGVNPGAFEATGDEVDSDCDDHEVCWLDGDEDGFHAGVTVTSDDVDCDDAGEGTASASSGDCDDEDAAAFPGGTEVAADGVDGNCDGVELCFVDADRDGYRVTATMGSSDADCADAGEATSTAPLDCDDTKAAVNEGMAETIGDEVDSNCDGIELCGVDDDGDGYQSDGGSVSSTDSDCRDAGEGRATEPSGDCDDTDAAVNPGSREVVADEVDQNCDGTEVCYADDDGDGVRTSVTVSSADELCNATGEAPESLASGDCDDDDSDVFPGAVEGTGDEVDQDCDGLESCFVDADEDGVRVDETGMSVDETCDGVGLATATADAGDCDDLNDEVFPGATDIVGDGIDNDCDGAEACFVDLDGDGWRPDETTTVSSADGDCDDAGEAGLEDGYGDCDDTDTAYNPGIAETECADPTDYNCDGSTGYADIDGDGWAACEECDDNDAARFPGASEAVGDNVDQDCDGLESCFVDADGDGHRSTGGETVVSSDEDCADEGESESSASADDCDDTSAERYPGAFEVVGDEVDGDCDGTEQCYIDADADGWRDLDDSVMASEDADCTDGTEAVTAVPAGDCNDADSGYNPWIEETDCTDPNDYNCDGSAGRVDDDGDGFAACEECDDNASSVNPDVVEVCNTVDDNCDTIIDLDAVDILTFYADVDVDGFGDPNVFVQACERPDGWVVDATDCDDTTGTVNPLAREVADDGIDQDCDGFDKISDPDTGENDTGETDTAEPDTGDSDTANPDTGTADSGDPDIVPDDTGETSRVGGLFGGLSCNAGGAGAGLGAVLAASSAACLRRRRKAAI